MMGDETRSSLVHTPLAWGATAKTCADSNVHTLSK